jgi:hypothetical protein
MKNKKNSWELSTAGGLIAGKSQAFYLLGLSRLDGMSALSEYRDSYGAWGLQFVSVLRGPKKSPVQKGERLLAAFGRLDQSLDGIFPAKNGVKSRYFLEALYRIEKDAAGVRLVAVVKPNISSRLTAKKVASGYRGLAVAVTKLTEQSHVRAFIDACTMNT